MRRNKRELNHLKKLLHSPLMMMKKSKSLLSGVEAQQNHLENLTFMQQNANIFTFTMVDMPNIDLEVMTYCLNMDPAIKPVK